MTISNEASHDEATRQEAARLVASDPALSALKEAAAATADKPNPYIFLGTMGFMGAMGATYFKTAQAAAPEGDLNMTVTALATYCAFSTYSKIMDRGKTGEDTYRRGQVYKAIAGSIVAAALVGKLAQPTYDLLTKEGQHDARTEVEHTATQVSEMVSKDGTVVTIRKDKNGKVDDVIMTVAQAGPEITAAQASRRSNR